MTRSNVGCVTFSTFVTLACTFVVGVAVLSDHWERVAWSQNEVMEAVDGDEEVEVKFGGRVLIVKSNQTGDIEGYFFCVNIK